MGHIAEESHPRCPVGGTNVAPELPLTDEPPPDSAGFVSELETGRRLAQGVLLLPESERGRLATPDAGTGRPIASVAAAWHGRSLRHECGRRPGDERRAPG